MARHVRAVPGVARPRRARSSGSTTTPTGGSSSAPRSRSRSPTSPLPRRLVERARRGHRPGRRRRAAGPGAARAGSTSTPPASCSPTPTPTASARRWPCSRCPFSLGVIVIIVVAMAQLAFVDPGAPRRGAGALPWPRPAQQLLHEEGRAARVRGTGPGRRRVRRRPRELRGRPGRQDPRPRGAGGRAPASAGRGSPARAARRRTSPRGLRTRPRRPAEPRHDRAALVGRITRGQRGGHDRRARASHGALRHPRLPVPHRRLPPRGAAPGRRGQRPADACARGAHPGRARSAARAPRRAARGGARRRGLLLRRGDRARRRDHPGDRRARSSRWSGRPAPARRPCAACSSTSSTRRAGRSGSAAPR